MACEVAVDAPAPNLYTYLLNPELDIKVGQMVQVPFGSRDLVGYVMSVGPAAGRGPFKTVRKILKETPLFGPEFLPLVRFVSQYYFYPIGLCVKEILPGGLAPKFKGLVGLAELPVETDPRYEKEPFRTLAGLYPEKKALSCFKDRSEIYRLIRAGLLTLEWVTETRGVDFNTEWWLWAAKEPTEPRPYLGPKQKAMWEMIVGSPPLPMSHFRNFFTDALAKARSLKEKGLIELERRIKDRDDPNRPVEYQGVKVEKLTQEQEAALKAISSGLDETLASGETQGFLLFGVTGSGKTEVYLRAAEKVLAKGRGVLWLAPEIALTLGLEGRLKDKFPEENISVLHSALTPGQRHDHWLKLVKGESRLVLGARSAVFAPVINPGLIIVDEEHDGAFKQGDGLRYHGRDLAAWRARAQGAVLILGSATPSMESYKAAGDGYLTLLKLNTRPGDSVLPPVYLVDRRNEGRGRAPLSAELAESLNQTLKSGDQALLFLNRRGLANLPLCLACGETLKCPHCSLSLTLHGHGYDVGEIEEINKDNPGTLVCHGCGYKSYPPRACPACGSPLVRYLGVGTEKLHRLVEDDYKVSAIKLDSDSAGRRGGLKKVLESFSLGEARVLVGTQMAAKGHDFPGLTLVGVVEADVGLNIPDFRAAEKTFQLLSQVSGRAGRRDRPGKVLIQTHNPEHYALKAAQEHDYEGFYEQEIVFRQNLRYPPYGKMALIRLSGPEANKTEELAEEAGQVGRCVVERLKTSGLEILGPAPAPVSKLKDLYIFQLLVRSDDHLNRYRLLINWLPRLRKSLPKNIILTVDIDPYSLL
jgi:primosomal protein N' (replication factor Y)